ncbi:MAG: hypothetical protein Q8N26_27315 [Myxococcales bacterium]|nr:hypothetical protein [Myxococcales bacterium]
MTTWEDTNGSRLVEFLATELEELTRGVRVGAAFEVPPDSRLCSSLEFFLPQLLKARFAKWRWESLDGFFVARATCTGPTAVELIGTCILISDQTVTPFLVQLEVLRSASSSSVAVPRLLLGEPGGGQLGISGPPCNSTAASRLFSELLDRIADVKWSYTID